MIIDTHCHYNLDPLFSEWQKHWQKAQAAGVTHSLVVGTTAETSQRAVSLAEAEPNLLASLAVHPYKYAEQEDLKSEQEQLTQLTANPKVVAIGETGLDYYRLEEDPQREKIIERQQAGFRFHIQLAKDAKRPLLLHVRDKGETAYWHTLQILKEEIFNQPFVLHCVSGPVEYVKQALEMGAFVSVAGNITYRSAEALREIIKTVPKDRILVETDAPYLAPQELRGQTCEPWMITKTVEFLEHELQLSREQFVINTKKFIPQLGNLEVNEK